MNDGNTTKAVQSSGKEPPPRPVSYVRCTGFRCLAFRDPEGRWRNYHNHELLPEVLEVLSDTPESPSART